MKLVCLGLLILGLISCEGTTKNFSKNEQDKLIEGCKASATSQTSSYKKQLGEKAYNNAIDAYCMCALEESMNADIPISDYNELSQKERNEIALECQQELYTRLGIE